MADLKLFDASLIDQAVKHSLPENYIMRPLAHDDYSKGFFECLQSLTWTGNVSRERFEERFDWLRTKGVDWFYDVVIEHQNRIVGTGVLLVERKFIWDLALEGHLEEITIAKEYQGRGLGRLLIQALTSVARNLGCYKVILNCSEENQGFYNKCGYKSGGMEMDHKLKTLAGESSSSSGSSSGTGSSSDSAQGSHEGSTSNKIKP